MGQMTCPDCNGHGFTDGEPDIDCETCLGDGWVYTADEYDEEVS